jgi:hypothetical protein
MRHRKPRLLLSSGRLWMMSLPFRLGCRLTSPGFSPGWRNLLAWTLGRWRHRLWERERVAYYLGRLGRRARPGSNQAAGTLSDIHRLP